MQAPTYGCRPGGNVRYKEMRFGDWLFTYSTNLNAGDLCLPGRWCEQGGNAAEESQEPVNPFCTKELVPYWRRRGSGSLELDDCSNQVTEYCEAFVNSEGDYNNVIFQVEEYDMQSATAVGTQIRRGFYELINDTIFVSTRSYCSNIVGYRNYWSREDSKYYTINIYNTHPTIKTHMDTEVLTKALEVAHIDVSIQEAPPEEEEEATPR